MLNDLQQKNVWECWLSAEIRAYYFADLASDAYRRQRTLTFATLLLSSGALVTLLTGLPTGLAWAPTALVFITTVLSLYALVTQYHQRAATCADLHVRWSQLARKYEGLWQEMYDEGAAARLVTLADDEDTLSKAGIALGRPNEGRLSKWQRYVEKRHAPLAVGASA